MTDPRPTLGTIEERHAWLMGELARLLPLAAPLTSACPPEVDYVRAIENVIARLGEPDIWDAVLGAIDLRIRLLQAEVGPNQEE